MLAPSTKLSHIFEHITGRVDRFFGLDVSYTWTVAVTISVFALGILSFRGYHLSSAFPNLITTSLAEFADSIPYYPYYFGYRLRSMIGRISNPFASPLSVAPPTKKSRPAVPHGLVNVANACYQNSVLQALSSIESLPVYLNRANFGSLDTAKSVAFTLAAAHRHLNTPNIERKWHEPNLLRNIAGLSVRKQSDAQEYFVKLIAKIDQERSNYFLAQADCNGLSSAKDKLEKDRILEALKNETPNPLEGYLRKNWACSDCHYAETGEITQFNEITLRIPSNIGRQEVSLESLLGDYFNSDSVEARCTSCLLRDLAHSFETEQKETEVAKELLQRVHSSMQSPKEMDELEKAYKLQNWLTEGGKSRNSEKRSELSIIVPPQALVLHVNRSNINPYSLRNVKLTNAVSVPRVLDIRKWCQEPSAEALKSLPRRRPSYQYRLKAVVEHFGSDNNGHYTCRRTWGLPSSLQEAGRWFVADDECVYPERQSTDDAESLMAMLVFYEEVPLDDGALPEDVTSEEAPKRRQAADEATGLPESKRARTVVKANGDVSEALPQSSSLSDGDVEGDMKGDAKVENNQEDDTESKYHSSLPAQPILIENGTMIPETSEKDPESPLESNSSLQSGAKSSSIPEQVAGLEPKLNSTPEPVSDLGLHADQDASLQPENNSDIDPPPANAQTPEPSSNHANPKTAKSKKKKKKRKR